MKNIFGWDKWSILLLKMMCHLNSGSAQMIFKNLAQWNGSKFPIWAKWANLDLKIAHLVVLCTAQPVETISF